VNGMIQQKPKHQNYRICYDNGNSTTGKKIYELDKYCRCSGCSIRQTVKREPSNRAVVTTRDISKVANAAEFLKNWSCENGGISLEPIFFKF
jgi:hypothetical protein